MDVGLAIPLNGEIKKKVTIHPRFGDCCGNNCGGWAFGEAAESSDWPEAPVTAWMAGSVQEVTRRVYKDKIQNTKYK